MSIEPEPTGLVTQLLFAAGRGDNVAADRALPLIYEQLIALARSHMWAPTTANVAIACTGGARPTVMAVSGSGAGAYELTQSAPMDSVTNTQDMLALIQVLNNGAANLVENLAHTTQPQRRGHPGQPTGPVAADPVAQRREHHGSFNGDGVPTCP